MAESVKSAVSAAETLLQTILVAKGICDGKSPISEDVASELTLFVGNLEDNIKSLRATKSAKSNSVNWAIEALQQELRLAAKEGHKILGKGFLECAWKASRSQSELRVLRERVMISFQTTIMLVALDVAIEKNEDQEEFQEALLRLQKLLQAHTTSSALALKAPVLTELEGVWRPVFGELQKRGDRSFEEATLLLKSIKPQTDDNQKFFANVLGELEKAQRERLAAQQGLSAATSKWYHDPVTGKIMCDPVKASDRRTYDRWTLIHNRSGSNPPLRIVLEDIDVRSRLFQKFPDQEAIYRASRSEYRHQALQKASRGCYSEALVMLNHVLSWAEDDSECQARRDEVQRHLGVNTPDIAPDSPPPPLSGAPSSSSIAEMLRDLFVDFDTVPWPSKLDIRTCNDNLLSISVDGLLAKYVKELDDEHREVAAVQANYPAPCGMTKPEYYYFEMAIKESGERGEISIGFSDKENCTKGAHVGWSYNTCGYHGDDGELYNSSEAGTPFGPKFGTGDVVGAGIHYGTNQLFFVRNGDLVGCVPNSIQGGHLYPTLGLTMYGQTVIVNFGQHGFANVVQNTWFTSR